MELRSSRRSDAARHFVVVSGAPASGKTTLGRLLAAALGLPLIDKDEILESLFDTRGIGDAGWRRALSRESDVLFRARAEAAAGAVLVSFWHVAGLPPHSGTPTTWLAGLDAPVANVICECPPEISAQRFASRRRHPGHLDADRRQAHWTRSLPVRWEVPADVTLRIDCTRPADGEALALRIARAFESLAAHPPQLS